MYIIIVITSCIIYYTLFNYLCVSHASSRSFWNGLVNIQLIVWLAIVASCVPPADSHMLARSVYHSESLSVLGCLVQCGMFVGCPSLPLAAEEFLQRILGKFFTEEKLDARNSEDVLHQVYK